MEQQSHATPPTSVTTTNSLPADPPPELPLTPQSNNKAINLTTSAAIVDNNNGEKLSSIEIPLQEDAASPDGQGVEVIAENNDPISALIGVGGSSQSSSEALKEYTRNMSALSISTESGYASSYEETTETDTNDPDTPKSSLVSTKKNNVNNDQVSGSITSLDTCLNNTEQQGIATQQQQQLVPPSTKAVDWLPQSNDESKSILSGTTNHSVKMGDDVTETSFTTMTTAGGDVNLMNQSGASSSELGDATGLDNRVGSPPVLLNGATPTPILSSRPVTTTTTTTNSRAVVPSALHNRGGGVKPARSPRPPRHMRAVDWCPPNANANLTPRSSGVGNNSYASSSSAAAFASDKTAVTSRAVRLGDDATVTTFATMTTMGDAGSILEADTEDEASDDGDDSSDDGEGSDARVTNGAAGRGGGEEEEEQSMEDVKDEDGEAVVDKIPSSYKNNNNRYGPKSSISGTTNHAVRATDDQSMVTFASMTTAGGGGMMDGLDRSSGRQYAQQQDMVDKVPQISRVTDNTSIVTNDTVQMGDNQSLATWATTNTMGGQLTGNVVDHVPNDDDENSNNQVVEPGGAAGDGGAGDGGNNNAAVSSNATINTSNAVRGNEDDDPSILTFTTAAGTSAGESAIDEVVDSIPTFAGGNSGSGTGGGRSIVSGITSQAIRFVPDDRSIASFATMTTMGDLGSIFEADVEDDDIRPRIFSNDNIIDRTVVDVIPEATSSVASGTTNRSVRTGEDGSVTTFATMTTAGRGERTNDGGNVDDESEQVVDQVPHYPNNEKTSIVSGTTNHAVRLNDDQSVATWVTTSSNVVGHINEHVVDQTPPSFKEADQSMMSETTNHAVKDSEDQSIVTWNTMTTSGVRSYAQPPPQQQVPPPGPYAVDRVPSFHKGQSAVSTSGTTNHAVRPTGDDQSIVTFATMTTVGGGVDRGRTDDIVDKVPLFAPRTDTTSIITNDTVQMGDNQSLATWATTNTMGGGQLTGNVVDHVPNNEEEETVGTTNAVKDDPSMITFSTAVTSGGVSAINEVVDHVPTFAGGAGRSVKSGITNQAVRMGDDRSYTSFGTMTTAGAGEYSGVYETETPGGEDELGSVSSSRFITAPSTTGILRESRHSRPVLRSASDSNAVAAAEPYDVPINAGESVSNIHILRAINDVRLHVDYRIGEMREMNQRDSERVLQVVQQEQTKRTALEARLHSQLLLQSESMVAMELKLLRLEAKVAQRDLRRQQRRQPGIAGGTTNITDRLPPIAATPSTPNQSDEEADSFEELELTPRGTNRQGAGLFTHGGMTHRGVMGPAIPPAMIARSGASVASAVTATSFTEGLTLNEDERSDDGDIEDEGDDENDGSASTPTQSSRNRITNLESILLNPIQGSNDQGLSSRAVRGETDGLSTMQTSVTSATMASTVVTSTTRGNESVGITRIASRASEEDVIREGVVEETTGVLRSRGSMRSNSDEFNISAESERQPRSRSHSPLTVQSAATGDMTASLGPSLGPSILSTTAVASSRAFGTRRANAAAANANSETSRSGSMANRVVSFTSNDLTAGVQSTPGPQENDGGGDSITMPDELDNFSDIADAFSNSARNWREEYESRLDAIHKRLG